MKLLQREMSSDIKIIMRNQTENTIDIVKLKAESKKSGGRAGGLWGAIVVILMTVADMLIK
jgi:hypothetical protein